MLSHSSPSSEWEPVGNTGEITEASKGIGYPTAAVFGQDIYHCV